MKGELEGASVAYVNASLRRQGIKPTKVRKTAKPLFTIKKRITAKDIAIFTRQLATMLTAGIPIAQAFDIVGKGHENPTMAELIMAVKNDIESGTNLTAALSKHPLQFDALYCNLVQAGEQAGILDTILDKVATYKEKIGVDFVVLSPVQQTTSHPGAITLGWTKFSQLATGCNLPVFALGGMSRQTIKQAKLAGAVGVAMLSGVWD